MAQGPPGGAPPGAPPPPPLAAGVAFGLTPTTIVPATPPQPAYYELNIPRLVAQSMSQRMELLDTELQIALETANVRVARHELLPLVSIQYTYNINGLGESIDDSSSVSSLQSNEIR